MKQALIFSTVLSFVLQSSAFAQTSSTTIAAPASAGNAAVAPAAATSVTEVAPKKGPISIKYLGIYEGPNFQADGTEMHNKDTYINHRPSIQANIADGITAGVQARFSTKFTKNGVTANNDTWRLYGNFKNVASYGIVSMDLIPRVMLPTAFSAHDRTMAPSPELLIAFNIAPENSRFSFAYTPQMLKYFYTDAASADLLDRGGSAANSFVLLHNIEGTYQLGATTQLTFGFYPEYTVTRNIPFTNDSNEVDVGVNFDVAKGWSLNPYIGMEPVGMGANGASPLKSMEAALVVSGTFL